MFGKKLFAILKTKLPIITYEHYGSLEARCFLLVESVAETFYVTFYFVASRVSVIDLNFLAEKHFQIQLPTFPQCKFTCKHLIPPKLNFNCCQFEEKLNTM